MGAMGSRGFSRQFSIWPPPGMTPPWVKFGPPWPLTNSLVLDVPLGVELVRVPPARLVARFFRTSFAMVSSLLWSAPAARRLRVAKCSMHLTDRILLPAGEVRRKLCGHLRPGDGAQRPRSPPRGGRIIG